MATSETVDWDVCGRCAEEGGIGIRLAGGERCWAHADEPDLDAALKRLGEDGRLDARGVVVTQELLERLLAAAPGDDHGPATLTYALFHKATFHGDAVFDQVTFQGIAVFQQATFCGRFAQFDRASFLGDAIFGMATFKGVAWFPWVTFTGDVMFDGVTFLQRAVFGGATFHRDTSFDEAVFYRDAWFAGATFQASQELGPMLVRKSLVLDDVIFHQRVQVHVSAVALCCRRARFLAGVQLRLRWAQVVLDDADLAAPSILAGVPPFPNLNEGRWARAVQRLLPEPEQRAAPQWRWRPRLMSLRRADVAGLTVAGVDLRACRFAGAHHLDQLRIDESFVGFTPFGLTPGGGRWTVRLAIAEEREWRAKRNRRDVHSHDGYGMGVGGGRQRQASHDGGWYPTTAQPPAWLPVEPAFPAQADRGAVSGATQGPRRQPG
jgi:uncharacterized protein YjbI with pentapeptide repeats